MDINLHKIPFSRRGSYLALNLADDGSGLALRTVYNGYENAKRELIRLVPCRDGKPIPFRLEMEPWGIRVEAEAGCGSSTMVLKGKGGLSLSGSGMEWSLEYLGAGLEGGYAKPLPMSLPSEAWRIIDQVSQSFLDLYPKSGDWTIEAPFGLGRMTSFYSQDGNIPLERHTCPYVRATIGGGMSPFRLILRIGPDEEPEPEFGETEAEISACRQEYERWCAPWLARLPAVHPHRNGAALALYVLWSSIVEPMGLLKRPAVLMSKNWMNNVWSWDHCFNALALASLEPALAADQLLLPFDHQSESGMLPDYVNNRTTLRTFTKPPVHGWCLRRLREKGVRFEEAELRRLYGKLVRWTDWWFAARDRDGDGICQYDHGFECGWDNSSAFDRGIPIESPDLTAYLLLQIDVLADLSLELGLPEETAGWRSRYDGLLEKFLAYFWVDGAFVTRHDGEAVPPGSLLNYMPAVLGEKLPESVFRSLTSALAEEGRYEAPSGFATEALNSPAYRPGASYWRGPVWAPVMYLLADGLRRGGAQELADRAAGRFLAAVAESGGMYENYDPVTGRGYDDPAYTWTAGVFLLLLEESLGV